MSDKTPPPSVRMRVDLPVPTADGYMSTDAKLSLAEVALALRDEQIEAKVVEYKGDLATNPELDAVTMQVIQEVRNLQAAARAAIADGAGLVSRPPPTMDKGKLEHELTQNLIAMLGRIFRKDKLATVVERKLGEVAKRFARTFFESELHRKIRGEGGEMKTMRFHEQALFHALTAVESDVLGQLDTFSYEDGRVRERAKERFADMKKELRTHFLARTTPELNALVSFLNEALTRFFVSELPASLGDLARDVVKEADLATANTIAGYKISASAFPRFRQAFERRFLNQLVPFVEEEMLRRVRAHTSPFRSETTRLVADPAIFSDTCEVICDAIYDMLYNDGFLDLPNDWRVRLSAEG